MTIVCEVKKESPFAGRLIPGRRGFFIRKLEWIPVKERIYIYKISKMWDSIINAANGRQEIYIVIWKIKNYLNKGKKVSGT